MRRRQLEALLREVERIAGASEVSIIGSQCIHAITDSVPGEVLMSLEVDVLVDESEPTSAAIDAALGPDSAYRQQNAVYVDTVPASFPFLPSGWEDRATRLVVGSLTCRCLEPHDLTLSKLGAGRLKDLEFIAALLSSKLVDLEVIRQRISAVSDLHMRAVLMARLQLVLETASR